MAAEWSADTLLSKLAAGRTSSVVDLWLYGESRSGVGSRRMLLPEQASTGCVL